MHSTDLLHEACLEAYDKEAAKLSTKDEHNNWNKMLESKLAKLSECEAQMDSAQRVLEYEEELVRLVSF